MLDAADAFLGALLTAGFTPRQTLYALDSVCVFTMGHAMAEFGTSETAAPDLDGTELKAQLAQLHEAGPHNLARVVADSAPHNYDAEFEHGLTALLRGHEKLLHRRAAPDQAR